MRDILRPFSLTRLRVVALHGDDEVSPALVIVCDGIGEIDVGWIGKTNVLANTLFGRVAPVGWRATAYQTLVSTLHYALPVFSYVDLLDEFSTWHWDGALDDETAREWMIDFHGHDPAEIDADMLPSGMNARRPDYMLAKNAAPLRSLPYPLRQKVSNVRRAHKALADIGDGANAWRYEAEDLWRYVPESEDWSHLPSMTLVPFEHFARELDAVGQRGMECGFTDIAGICPITDPVMIDRWLASFRLGADLLIAAQDLIDFDPAAL